MISEGSCDTEDWRNGDEIMQFSISGMNYILKYITIGNSYFKLYKY